ncbi:predicted protein [Lichtheimia corymbifera JMRC:FSU:9682]|uniref:Uncharacterized protein n=1 Tax=Lichtheimia corymbifera JMRC:FSU:9682 TaxID=1263082 RepID=A0A068RQ05_9FUNG|nr:predicted protein [Lichtheimia corymbifera JMRC:FSU:9682]
MLIINGNFPLNTLFRFLFTYYSNMYSGHFAFANVIRRWYPDTPAYVLVLGVGWLDVVFALLCCWGIEGFVEDPSAGLQGASGFCDYSHSLFGTIVLSALYGAIFGIPGMVASLSHWIQDWVVHNDDLFLDPFSKILLGGTNFWSRFPELAFYFEALFIVVCACAAPDARKPRTIAANAFLLALHVISRFMLPTTMKQLVSIEDDSTRYFATGANILVAIIIPVIVMSTLLQPISSSSSAETQRKRD